MDSAKRKLIDELCHNSRVASQLLEQRLADTAAWFFSRKDDLARDNLAARQDFLEKTCWLLIEICALQADRLHKLEGNRAGLWLPKGMEMRGDVRKFG